MKHLIADMLRRASELLRKRAEQLEEREAVASETRADIVYAERQLIAHACEWARMDGRYGTSAMLKDAVYRWWAARDAREVASG